MNIHAVVGGWSGASNSVWTPAPTHAGAISDPLASLAPPSTAGSCVAGSHSYSSANPVTLSPGVYCDQIRLSGNANVTLQSGVYVLFAGLSISGNGNLQTSGGVLLYDTCRPSPCNGARPADISVSGNGNISWTGLSTYDNVLLWVDRTAGAGTNVTVTGNGAGTQWGIVYAITSQIAIAGNRSEERRVGKECRSRRRQ